MPAPQLWDLRLTHMTTLLYDGFRWGFANWSHGRLYSAMTLSPTNGLEGQLSPQMWPSPSCPFRLVRGKGSQLLLAPVHLLHPMLPFPSVNDRFIPLLAEPM